MNWNNIEEMFDSLHENNISYIVLRNYEEIDDDNFYVPGHADIDFLTLDSKKFSNIIQAQPRFQNDDGIHYIVKISNVDVVIDVRSLGDGYYDTKWEKSLLKNRVLFDNRFYIPDDTNYYYSLVYHAILQKQFLSEEYLQRLNALAEKINIDAKKEDEHLKKLEEFLIQNEYYYTYPYDIHVPLRVELVSKNLIKKYLSVCKRDFIISILKFGSKVKHKILKY